MSELAGLLLSTESFEELLQGVAELSVRAIGPVATCGITLAQDDRVIILTGCGMHALAVVWYVLRDSPSLTTSHDRPKTNECADR